MITTGSAIFRAAAAVLDSMPGSVRGLAADCTALGSYFLSPGKRRNVLANLSVVGAPRSGGDIRGIFRVHSLNIMEMFASSRWDDAKIGSRVEFPGRDILDRALSAGKGAIIATAHIGNWELPALLLSSEGYRLGVVAGEQMNTLLTDSVRRAKESRGIEVIGPGSPYRRLYRLLRDGGIVALLLDGDIFEGGTRTELFGRAVSLPRGAAKLAERTGAPVLGAYCRRIRDDLSRISMETVLAPGEAGVKGEEESQTAVFSAIERYIRENSDQWCIFRSFWEGAA